MFDIFYIGPKPSLFSHEQAVENLEQAQQLSRTRYCWVIHYLLDYSNFDFLWEPVPWQGGYTHVWPTQWPEFYGVYLVPKQGDIKFHYHSNPLPARQFPENYRVLTTCEFDQSWVPHPWDPPYIYVFGNQWHRSEIMPTVEYHVPGATERKYMDWPVATLLPDSTNWSVPEGIDANTIDFSWVPDPSDPPYIYQFATQHQKTGGPVYTVPGATEVKYLESVQFEIEAGSVPVIEIDHMDGNSGKIPGSIKRIRYFDNYRDTLIRVSKSMLGQHEFIWICSSICDYTNFDFTWHPEKWQSTMLHVFASDEQKFGDTFYMHVPTFAERAEKKALLEWYAVNFVPAISVPRRPLPQIQHSFDSHVDVVQEKDVLAPLILYTKKSVPTDIPTVPLWRAETKTIVPLDLGASSVIVPREVKPYIKTQLYDYPYIDKTHRKNFNAELQDVVFISYDEPEADQNWNLLKQTCARAQRIHGISGMEVALEAAADVSNTPWYFAVFAKTRLHKDFDFSFVPDYMQQPKHYIFDCLNASNNLQYGHMGIVMYNCKGIKHLNQQQDFGLDYTLSFPHESVPLLSCYGEFAITPYHAWRTAFRECAKLSYFEHTQPSVEGQYRLRTWTRFAQGANSKWVLTGAKDGVEFFESTQGDLQQLKRSFRWQWLREYFANKYGDLD